MKAGLAHKLPLEPLWVSELTPGGRERLFFQPCSRHGASESDTERRMNTRRWKCLLESPNTRRKLRGGMLPRRPSVSKSAGGVAAKIARQGQRHWKELEVDANRSTLFQSCQRLMCWAVPIKNSTRQTLFKSSRGGVSHLPCMAPDQ